MKTKLSSVVMTHPQRLAHAKQLVATAGLSGIVQDPAPDMPSSPIRTALRAWGAVAPEASHHLVVQDDILTVPFMTDLVIKCVQRHPRAALAFYSNWNSRNGTLVRLAALAGASWIDAAPLEYTPTLALCLPADVARDFARHTTDPIAPDDDAAMARFLREREIPVLLSVPNVIEHMGVESLSGNNHHGIRRATCFYTGDEVIPRLVEGPHLRLPHWLPSLFQGEGFVLSEDAEGGPLGKVLPWEEGLQSLQARCSALAAALETEPPRHIQKVIVESFGVRYTNDLWAHGVMLGWQAAGAHRGSPPPDTHDPIRLKALESLGPSSLNADRRSALTEFEAQALTFYGSTSVAVGARSRSLGQRADRVPS
ncbi:hypothetical protein ABZ635_08860 [Nocardiopsis sp. NPDC007018]|uniref:hypothetical protein n=1 Tax=Nocardiopsis sp. NPDC007018 TaxID=3155721 RepID=UPI0033E6CA6A